MISPVIIATPMATITPPETLVLGGVMASCGYDPSREGVPTDRYEASKRSVGKGA